MHLAVVNTVIILQVLRE